MLSAVLLVALHIIQSKIVGGIILGVFSISLSIVIVFLRVFNLLRLISRVICSLALFIEFIFRLN